MKKNTAQPNGQIAIIVLLITVVIITLALSTATRSTRDTSQSIQEESSSRSFNAAEAGIEEALTQPFGSLSLDPSPRPFGGDLVIRSTSQGDNKLNIKLAQGHSQSINLVKNDATSFSGLVSISWQPQSHGWNCAGIVVALLREDAVERTAYKANTCTDLNDGFTQVVGTGDIDDQPLYNYQKSIDIPANGYKLMRIRSIYNPIVLHVTSSDASSNPLPVQVETIKSAGTNKLGGETRVIEVKRSVPSAPTIFDYVLFSGSNITK